MSPALALSKSIMTNQTVLVTGASKGIGMELARQFARHGYSIIITATSEEQLGETASNMQAEFSVPVRFIAADLLDPETPRKLHDALKADGTGIDILVNNAGLGHHGWFVDQPADDDVEMIRVNIEALVRMTKIFLPGMVARRSGRILNTASIAGFMPAPQMAVYHATKAFVLSFTEALAEELKDSGVTVTALCPGATDTDFFKTAGAVDTMAFQNMQVMSPQEVAKGGYEALMNGDRVYVAGGMNKAMVFMRRMMPDSVMAKMTKFFYSDTDPEDHKRDVGDIAAKSGDKA
jgi:short-subunit dehydrogenase